MLLRQSEEVCPRQSTRWTHDSRKADSRTTEAEHYSQNEPKSPYNNSQDSIRNNRDAIANKDNSVLNEDPRILPQSLTSREDIQQDSQLKPQPITKRVLSIWWPEISWCMLTIGLLIALIVLLKSYDKKPAPQWPHDISLNTVIAAIATVCRASMVIPISEGLSQLKWNAFARSQRPLIDLVTFDQASRGPFGSLLLLSKTKGRILGVSTLAAVILLSSLATSSLTQATITFAPPLRELSKDASMGKLRTINRDDLFKLDDSLQSAAFQSFFIGERERKSVQIKPRCPSSNCHWDKFRSIDICSVQKNITDKLAINLMDPGDLDSSERALSYEYAELEVPPKQREYWNVSLGGLTVQDKFEVHDAVLYNTIVATYPRGYEETVDLWENETSTLLQTHLASHAFIYKKLPDADIQAVRSYKGDKSPYRAVLVTWYWCIKEYEVSVIQGTPRVQGTETDFSISSCDPVLGSMGQQSGVSCKMIDDATSEAYSVTYTRGWKLSFAARRAGWMGADYALMQLPLSRILGNVTKMEDDPWDNIMRWNEDTTLAMSAVIRSYKNDDENTAWGYAEVGPQSIAVRWAWLSLLITQVVLMVVFVVYVIIETARANVKVVKGSNIAELTAVKSPTPFTELENLLVGGICAKIDADLVGRLVEKDGSWNLEVHRRTP